MLLYVDKKKEKRRKIKIITFIVTSLLILIANLLHFTDSLHHTKQQLINFASNEPIHNWYQASDVVTIFTQAKKTTPTIIIIPKEINRENSLIIAFAFSKLPATAIIEYSPEIKEDEYLKQLAALSVNSSKKTFSKHKTLVTTNLSEQIDNIKTNKLYPSTLNYQAAQKLNTNQQINDLINQTFPLPQPPANTLEQEKKSLASFANKYHQELKNLIRFPSQKITFTKKSLLLQNVSVCIQTSSTYICQTNKNKSLLSNINSSLKQLPKNDTPTKLLLLTNTEEININTPLKEDEGALFKYGKITSCILPHEKNKKIDTYTLLKQKAGINSEYQTPDMKFFKFKTLEVTLDD